MKKEIDVQKLIELYKSETPLANLCEMFHISKQTVYNILKSEGVDLNRQKLHENCGCPLFKKDLYNNIYCEDFGDWEFLTLSFADKKAKNAHKKRFCSCNGYAECSIYKLLEDM